MRVLAAAALFMLACSLQTAAARPSVHRPVPAAPAPPPSAEIVVDLVTGRVVWSRNAEAVIRPASLAKLMTLELLFDAMDVGSVGVATRIPVSAAAAARPNTKLGIPAGSSVSAGEAALCLAVHSCNDVATAVAEALGGDEPSFARAMTAAGRRLGLRRSNFANASGLPDPGNATTARDLALLGAALIARHPSSWRVLSVPSWTFGDRTFENTNRLLTTFPGMEGGKTGYTRESGFHLLAVASRGGRRVLAVVAGGQTARARDIRMEALLDAALRPVAVTAVR